MSDLEPPSRNGEYWFRDADTVRHILCRMRSGQDLDPIKVWSKQKTSALKFKVKDGFHRFHLSAMVGFTKIPVIVDDFEMCE